MKVAASPDPAKARALVALAKITLSRLQETDLLKYPSNSLTDYYDILHKLLDARACQEGIKFKGDGAHQELIDTLCKILPLPEPTRIFLQELREYRNRISYEGFSVTKEYISSNIERIEAIIKKLLLLLKQ